MVNFSQCDEFQPNATKIFFFVIYLYVCILGFHLTLLQDHVNANTTKYSMIMYVLRLQ